MPQQHKLETAMENIATTNVDGDRVMKIDVEERQSPKHRSNDGSDEATDILKSGSGQASGCEFERNSKQTKTKDQKHLFCSRECFHDWRRERVAELRGTGWKRGEPLTTRA